MNTLFWGRTLLASVLLTLSLQAADYYVDVTYDGTNGAPDGSEIRPWTRLGDAVAAFTTSPYGHTIRVAAGEYKSLGEGGLENFGTTGYNLERRSGTWRGGYVGQVEGAIFDWSEASRMSPDADTLDPSVVTVINLTNAHSRAFTSTGADHFLIFHGFVFRDSYVTQANYHGGGLEVNGQLSASAVRECVFLNNRTTGNGGGLWLRGRQGVSYDCHFIGNTSLAFGGGAYVSGDNISHTLENSVFRDNTAAESGGGLFVEHHVHVENCHFEGNLVTGSGESVGGGLGVQRAVMVKRSTFVNNAVPNGWGGALGGRRWQNIFVTVENSLVVSNSAAHFAVASYASHSSAALTIRHVTLADNVGGGAIAKAGNASFHASLSVLNSIIANNGEVGLEYTDAGSLTVDFNNVWNHTNHYVGFGAGPNDLSADPLFINAGASDYRLSPASPSLDTGTDAGVMEDIDGFGRPARTGFDMGAYEEWQLPAVWHRHPIAQIEEITPRFMLSHQPVGFPTDIWLVLDTEDKASGDVTDWSQFVRFEEPVAGEIHSHTFTGLAPDTDYVYRLWVSNAYDTTWGTPGEVRTLPSGAPLQLLWNPTSQNQRWSTNVGETNWTPNAGATLMPWVQGASAVFDGIPTITPNVWGGAMTFNAIRLTGAASGTLTIGRVSGNDADHLVGVGHALVHVPAGTTISLPQISGTAGLVLDGGGTLISGRSFTYTGDTVILNGAYQHLPPPGTIHMLDTLGSANAMFRRSGVNSSWVLNHPIVVRGGSTGMAIIENASSTLSGFSPALTGPLSITNTLRIRGDTRIGSISFTLSGDIEGPGELQLDFRGWGHNVSYVLGGDNSEHTGPLTILNTAMTNVVVQIHGTQGTMNITVPVNVAVSGTGTLIFNIADEQADHMTLGSGASVDLTGFTLQPKLLERIPGEYPIITPKSAVSGTFEAVVGTFTVAYDGTETHPDSVVLTVPSPARTLFILH